MKYSRPMAYALKVNPVRLIVSIMLAVVPTLSSANEVRQKQAGVRGAIERGLGFLAKDALAWKAQHNCVSCHHAALVIWSMHEANKRGYSVDEPLVAELTKWVAESGDGRTGVPRPAGVPKALNAKAVWFALALGADPKPDAVSQQGLKLLAKTVEGDQTGNGAWASWPDTRSPIFGNSDENMTAIATLALLPIAAAGDSEAKTVCEKGVKWLRKTKTDDDPQSVAMRLVLWKKLDRPAKEWQPLVRRIKERQNADGGWSQTPGMASDAWATGQALYALSHAGIKPGEPAITRAQAFLIENQRDDGSWPMTSRPVKPGGEGCKSLIPITAAGSAWAVLGLVRIQSPQAPKLLTERAFTCASVAEAVKYYVSLGEERAVKELEALTLDWGTDSQHGFSVNERIGWLCRILFEPKGAYPLRPPAFGGLSLPTNAMPPSNWPLYPAAHCGSSYFVLSEGYSVGGLPEPPKRYIAFCRKDGVFRTKAIPVPTGEQALRDAAGVRQTAAWRSIKWRDKGPGFRYFISEESVWSFVKRQAKAID